MQSLDWVIKLLSTRPDQRSTTHWISVPDLQAATDAQQSFAYGGTQESGAQQSNGCHQMVAIKQRRSSSQVTAARCCLSSHQTRSRDRTPTQMVMLREIEGANTSGCERTSGAGVGVTSMAINVE